VSHNADRHPRRNWSNQPPGRGGRDRAARGSNRHRNPDASRPADRDLNDDISRLSEAEERDLHFNGHPLFRQRPLHELCSPGWCRYKTEAENCADLESWYRSQNRELGKDDPEAEP
jgi:hypothetical protein